MQCLDHLENQNLIQAPELQKNLDLEIGDDVRFCMPIDIHHSKEGPPSKVSIQFRGQILKDLSGGNYKVIVLSIVPCDWPLKRGISLDIHESEIWSYHAPGSYSRYEYQLINSNMRSRLQNKKKLKKTCSLPGVPCHLHHHELSTDFVDLRGCWHCGTPLIGEGKKLWPELIDEKLKEDKDEDEPEEAEKPMTIICRGCDIAQYCGVRCAKEDALSHFVFCKSLEEE